MKEKDAPLNLCMDVLGRLQDAGVLERVVIIGSWCTYFYRKCGILGGGIGTLRTDDIDFLVPRPLRGNLRVNIPGMVKDIGFIVVRGRTGAMQLEHADMKMEFLVPERGRGSDAPHNIGALGVFAQPLRFLDFLLEETILVDVGGVRIRLPLPVRFGLHKVLISGRRHRPDKKAKDIEQGIDVLRASISGGKSGKVKEVFHSLPPKWRKAIMAGLKGADDLLGVLSDK